MKVPITIKIDHNKKQLFESTKQIHGLTFTDATDEATTGYLSKIAPSKLLELEIKKTEDNLTKLKETLLKVKSVQEQIKNDTRPAGSTDEQLTKIREEKYEGHKRGIKTQIKNNSISWKKIADVFMFKNKMEAQVWIMDKIEQEKE